MNKNILDVGAGGATGLGLIGFLGYVPEILAAVASLCAIVWYGIRFYDYIKTRKSS